MPTAATLEAPVEAAPPWPTAAAWSAAIKAAMPMAAALDTVEAAPAQAQAPAPAPTLCTQGAPFNIEGDGEEEVADVHEEEGPATFRVRGWRHGNLN